MKSTDLTDANYPPIKNTDKESKPDPNNQQEITVIQGTSFSQLPKEQTGDTVEFISLTVVTTISTPTAQTINSTPTVNSTKPKQYNKDLLNSE